MKRAASLSLVAALVFSGGVSLFGQERGPDNGGRDAIGASDSASAGAERPGQLVRAARVGDRDIFIPGSSIEGVADRGVRAHTNHAIALQPMATAGGPQGETPASLRAVYGNLASTGGAGVIAVVDAYDYPTAAADLYAFSTQFGLPSACIQTGACFQTIYGGGKKPAADCGWAQESALDIEWAHAMAPNAKIVLVEAASSSFSDLFQAVDAASAYIAAHGGLGEVSMSWGGAEFRGENSYDSHFSTKSGSVVFFASSGDTGGQTIYPATSANVVAAGGTRINRSSSGAFLSETAWSGSGGGSSPYELRPSFQVGISGIVGNSRGVPDLSFDADPNSGVAVYDSTVCQRMSGWMVFGGTSVAAPSLAGVANLAGHFYLNSAIELGNIYATGDAADFRDITSGTAGKYQAKTGWDFVTGVGSPLGTAGK